MKRTVLVLVSSLLLIGAPAWATSRTLAAVANVQGQALFQSDVRVFNPSYTATISVTAKYHYCSGAVCNHEKDETFPVAPREAKAFDDIAVSLFALANTQGAIEFDTDAADLVVTSRLYSNSLICQGSVGQFVPGLEDEDAYPISVLTSLQQSADFRTNIVMFNPSSSVTLPVRVQVFDGDSGSQLGSDFTVSLGPEVFFPSSNLFNLVSAGAATSANAYAKVTGDGTHGLFVACSVLDNHSQDTIFIKGESDLPAPAGQVPVANFTESPTSPTAGAPVQFTDTSTGSPTAWSWNFGDGGTSTLRNPVHTFAAAGSFQVSLTASNSSGANTHNSTLMVTGAQPTDVTVTLQQFSYNDGNPIMLHVGTTYVLHFHALDNGQGSGHGFSGISPLGIAGRSNIMPGNDYVTSPVTPTADKIGTYTFACTTVCGAGHSGMIGTLTVQP